MGSVWEKMRSVLTWLPSYVWQCRTRRTRENGPTHLIIAVADHFEPSVATRKNGDGPSGTRCQQVKQVERWCRAYPTAVNDWRDDDGRPFRHTFFYPAEEYAETVIEPLMDLCRTGWGEIEIHLHHGINSPDTAENTRQAIVEFRDALAARGCLSRENGVGGPRYAFVHGNWALANSAQGRFCGVDNEMQVLADTGCYADFTLPSAPSTAQVNKINSLYECALPFDQAAPHRQGIDLQCCRPPSRFPLIVQGPLMVNFNRRKNGWRIPGIENGELTASYPPSMDRLRLWRDAAINVQGRSEWLFVKLHCHGMEPRDEAAMHGAVLQRFLRELVDGPCHREEYRLHFVTAREMVNIILAACDGHTGSPGEFRDYRFHLIQQIGRN